MAVNQAFWERAFQNEGGLEDSLATSRQATAIPGFGAGRLLLPFSTLC